MNKVAIRYKRAASVVLMGFSIELFMVVVSHNIPLKLTAFILLTISKILLPIATLLRAYYLIPDWFDNMIATIKLKAIQIIGLDMNRRQSGIRFPGLLPIVINLLRSVWFIFLQFAIAMIFIPLMVIVNLLLIIRSKRSTNE